MSYFLYSGTQITHEAGTQEKYTKFLSYVGGDIMPLPKEIVEEQIREIGQFATLSTKKEIEHLPQIMREGERILFLTSGFVDDGTSLGSTCLITATSMRLIFVGKGIIFGGLKQVELPYEQISTISHSMGMIHATIFFGTSSGKMKVQNIPKRDLPKMVEIVSNRIHTTHTNVAPPAQLSVSSVSEEDLIQKLEKLAALKERGILSDVEFNAAKAKILPLDDTNSSKELVNQWKYCANCGTKLSLETVFCFECGQKQ